MPRRRAASALCTDAAHRGQGLRRQGDGGTRRRQGAAEPESGKTRPNGETQPDRTGPDETRTARQVRIEAGNKRGERRRRARRQLAPCKGRADKTRARELAETDPRQESIPKRSEVSGWPQCAKPQAADTPQEHRHRKGSSGRSDRKADDTDPAKVPPQQQPWPVTPNRSRTGNLRQQPQSRTAPQLTVPPMQCLQRRPTEQSHATGSPTWEATRREAPAQRSSNDNKEGNKGND